MHSLRPEMQYATLAQQGETAQLGMWVFIATETLFFGALIFTYFIYRQAYPEEFARAARDAILWCGTVNIVLLLTSSLTMVLSIVAAADGRRRDLARWLMATAALGILFLPSKATNIYPTTKTTSCPRSISSSGPARPHRASCSGRSILSPPASMPSICRSGLLSYFTCCGASAGAI